MSQPAQEKLVKDIKEVIADAEALIRQTAGELSGKAKEAHAHLADKLELAKSKLKDAEVVVREKASEGARQTDRLVRQHPYESIGIAFGVGLLVGILVNRK